MNLQPNSRNCFVCGLENPVGLKLRFHDDGVGEVRCEYRIGRDYQGYPGIAHGGVIAAILDEVAGRVAMIGDRNHFLMTARIEVTYRQPVPVETPLVVAGRATQVRGRVTHAAGEIRLPDGSVAVEAVLTLVDLPEHMRVGGTLEALGWKVYP
jgi:acyl-coenzyme A thioesterase PaaI-like protein